MSDQTTPNTPFSQGDPNAAGAQHSAGASFAEGFSGSPQPSNAASAHPFAQPWVPYATSQQVPTAPQPYAQWQPYGYNGSWRAPDQPKRRIWPWVLLTFLVMLALGLGGCAACSSIAYKSGYEAGLADGLSRDYGSDSFHDLFGYDFDLDDLFGGFSDDGSSGFTGYTYDEIMAARGEYDNLIENGGASNGIYEVGEGKDLAPGRYFLEGDPLLEGSYLKYVPTDVEGTYALSESILFFGSYYAELESGEIIVYQPAGDERMMPVDAAGFAPQAPYASGLYLVGTDIPAGTYVATCDSAAAENASDEAAVYLMESLDWAGEPVTDAFYLREGGSHTIELVEGQYVEAYAATLTPQGAEAPAPEAAPEAGSSAAPQ